MESCIVVTRCEILLSASPFHIGVNNEDPVFSVSDDFGNLLMEQLFYLGFINQISIFILIMVFCVASMTSTGVVAILELSGRQR